MPPVLVAEAPPASGCSPRQGLAASRAAGGDGEGALRLLDAAARERGRRGIPPRALDGDALATLRREMERRVGLEGDAAPVGGAVASFDAVVDRILREGTA